MTEIAGKPVVLDAGGHSPSDGKACVMEWVHVQWMVEHGFTLTEAWESLNDSPECTDPVVYRAAQVVNDRLPEDGRQQLASFIPRLARCHTPTDPVKARRVRVRVSCWAARQVLHLIDNPDRRTIALTAIQTAEAWLRGEAPEEDCYAAASAASSAAYAAAASYAAASAASAAAASSAASYASYAAASAASSAAAAASYASAAAAASAASSAAAAASYAALVSFLDELLDQWDKAVAEEGCALDEGPVPTQPNGS